MHKNIKKLTSIFLSIIITLSFVTSVSANVPEDNVNSSISSIDTDNTADNNSIATDTISMDTATSKIESAISESTDIAEEIADNSSITISSTSEETIAQEEPSIVVEVEGIGEINLSSDGNGNYSGETTVQGSIGGGKLGCLFSGYTGGIANLYQVSFQWTGNVPLSRIRYKSFTIRNGSWLADDKKPLCHIEDSGVVCGGLSSGTAYITTLQIPASITSVRVNTAGLQVYFLSDSAWNSTTEINNTYPVN